jgi:hypothetical protein
LSLIVLTEGACRTPAVWRHRLALSEEVWSSLIADGVFSPARGKDRGLMRLDFVGLVGLHDSLVACIPRFGLQVADPIAWLRRVLGAYFARESRHSRKDALRELHYRDEAVFREVDALATLLSSFAERGLHHRAVAASTPRGSGMIDWAGTMRRCEPLVSNGSPLYPEPYRWERRTSTNEVSLLQAAATAWLARRYGSRWPPGLADAVAGIDLDARMSRERAPSDLALLSRERAVTYFAADLRLLDALEAVVSRQRRMEGVAGARLHGTTAFALVWEDALRDLFGDDAADASLGHAKWYDAGRGGLSGPHLAPERRLDLLIRHRDVTLLLDAKYHHPFPASRPGWSDIVKQVYYGESLVRSAGERVRNAFLLPGIGYQMAFAGLVRIEDAARDFPPVEAWTLDPGWVFSSYGDGDLARRTRARDAILAARDEVSEMLGQT